MSVPAAAPLDQFLEHLNIGTTEDETEVQRMLVAATGVAEGLIGPIVHRAATARLDIRGGSGLLAPAPVAELTSLTGIGGAPNYTAGQVDVDGDTGVVTGAGVRLTDGAYTAAYVAGRAEDADGVDESISLAVCIIGKHLWETQRGRGNNRGGALGAAKQSEERIPLGFLIPHRARALLAPEEPLPVA